MQLKHLVMDCPSRVQTLGWIFQYVLHLFHCHLQHLCILHLGMNLLKRREELHQNQAAPCTCAGRWCAVCASYSRLCPLAKSAAPANSHWCAPASSSPPEVSGSAKFTVQLSETPKKKRYWCRYCSPFSPHCRRRRLTFLSVLWSPNSNSSPSMSSSVWLDRAEGAMLVEA